MIQLPPLPPAALRDRILKTVPWAANGTWDSLFGGRTNACWRLTSENGRLSVVLKLYRQPLGHSTKGNPLFPNDPHAEATLLTHLAKEEYAPKLLDVFESEFGTCIVYENVPGTRWQNGVLGVANLIQSVHATPPPAGLRAIPNGSADLLQQTETILSLCQNTDALTAQRPVGHVCSSAKNVLVHCDIVPGNLINNADDLYLIDWQCPGFGDACEDLANFLSPAMQLLYRGDALTKSEVEEFLGAFPAELSGRYRSLAPFYHYRMAAYCLWQSQNDGPDYAEGLSAEIDALKTFNAVS